MENILLSLKENGDGSFDMMEDSAIIGTMAVNISGERLTVYHTEVVAEAEGKGVAKQLLKALLEHARKNHLDVVPFCPYVLMQFKRHPEEYADVWKTEKIRED